VNRGLGTELDGDLAAPARAREMDGSSGHRGRGLHGAGLDAQPVSFSLLFFLISSLVTKEMAWILRRRQRDGDGRGEEDWVRW
jgi:hypothetical protein